MTSHVDNTREFELKTDDGQALFIRDWPLAGSNHQQLQQGVVIMHGLGEHCGRYAHVARFFNALGFVVRSYDHRGHGQSDGASGDVPDSTCLLRDAQVVINDFSQQLSGPPILLGHSMGGLFAARYALEQLSPLRALILSSPALAIRMSAFQHGLLKVASSLIPGVGLPNGLQTRYLSHDGEVVIAYQNDALVHTRLSARLLTSMLQAMDFCHAHAAELNIPLLLMVAGDDHLVDPAGSRRFHEKLTGSAVSSAASLYSAHYYPEFYHEIFNELDATRVFDDLRTWLELQKFTPVEVIQQAA
ncbi:alpha/beta hydrolase [Undibacterium sp. TS12]|uniref:alpha/beta hydrolase n=1 Tax=Undibacterium sp. TS12 TaxID=2908202 RepID=UPI001F4D0843|nr:alpha/beta hydrolase [Undibacterium sp. TS12]MCH8618058.1 lysophospholipase [Undibacterium sp. TS12]